jgi:hypothetical protein
MEYKIPFNKASKEKIIKYLQTKNEEIDIIYNEVYRP